MNIIESITDQEKSSPACLEKFLEEGVKNTTKQSKESNLCIRFYRKKFICIMTFFICLLLSFDIIKTILSEEEIKNIFISLRNVTKIVLGDNVNKTN